MRIAFLAVDFLPNIGGIANHVYNLALAIRRAGHDCRVIHLTTNRKLPSQENIDGLPVVRFKMPPYMRIKKLTALLTTGSVLVYLRKFAPDVVHWHELSNAWLPLRALIRAPLKVVTIHSARFLRHMKHPLGRLSNRLQLAFANFTITPDGELKKNVFKLSASPVFSIPNGVDVDRFRPMSSLKGRDNFVVVCPRRLVPKNGVEYLLHAVPEILADFPKTEIWFAGDGRLMVRLRKMAEELKVDENVKFCGHVPYERMPDLYRDTDIVVIPSLVEATSLACLEAMASGCGVVASNVGGLAEIIEDGVDGLLVEPANPAEIAKAVVRLLKDRELLKNIGERARKKVVSRFSWDVIAKQVLQLYTTVLTNR